MLAYNYEQNPPQSAQAYYKRISSYVDFKWSNPSPSMSDPNGSILVAVVANCSKCGDSKLFQFSLDISYINHSLEDYCNKHSHRLIFLDIEPIMQSIRRDIGLDFDNPGTMTEANIKLYREAGHKLINNMPDGFGLIVNRGKDCERVVEIEQNKHL